MRLIVFRLFNRFVATVRAYGVPVATGRFGAKMEMELVNDGPATFVWRNRRSALP